MEVETAAVLMEATGAATVAELVVKWAGGLRTRKCTQMPPPRILNGVRWS